MSMVSALRSVAVKRPEQAFRSQEAIHREWASLAYTRPPDFHRAVDEHRQIVRLLEDSGATVCFLPEDPRTGLDSIYVHDPLLATPAGAIVLQTGKDARRGEGPAFADALRAWDMPILGSVEASGTAEAGDLVWLDDR